MKGHADRNASLVIGQRLVARYQQSTQEKPPTPLAPERSAKAEGVLLSQEAESLIGPSIRSARHGETHEHGTAQETAGMAGCSVSDMPRQLRLFNE